MGSSLSLEGQHGWEGDGLGFATCVCGLWFDCGLVVGGFWRNFGACCDGSLGLLMSCLLFDSHFTEAPARCLPHPRPPPSKRPSPPWPPAAAGAAAPS